MYSLAQEYHFRVCKRNIITHLLLKDSAMCTTLRGFTSTIENLVEATWARTR